MRVTAILLFKKIKKVNKAINKDPGVVSEKLKLSVELKLPQVLPTQQHLNLQVNQRMKSQ